MANDLVPHDPKSTSLVERVKERATSLVKKVYEGGKAAYEGGKALVKSGVRALVNSRPVTAVVRFANSTGITIRVPTWYGVTEFIKGVGSLVIRAGNAFWGGLFRALGWLIGNVNPYVAIAIAVATLLAGGVGLFASTRSQNANDNSAKPQAPIAAPAQPAGGEGGEDGTKDSGGGAGGDNAGAPPPDGQSDDPNCPPGTIPIRNQAFVDPGMGSSPPPDEPVSPPPDEPVSPPPDEPVSPPPDEPVSPPPDEPVSPPPDEPVSPPPDEPASPPPDEPASPPPDEPVSPPLPSGCMEDPNR